MGPAADGEAKTILDACSFRENDNSVKRKVRSLQVHYVRRIKYVEFELV
jgi:hypothetical protein